MNFPSAILQALPSSVSDHAALLLLGAADIPQYSTFRFEVFWLRMEGFHDTVLEAWDEEVNTSDPLRRFHVKLERTTKALKGWHKKNSGNLRLQMAIAREVIGRLDVAEEARALSTAERRLRASLRAKIVGLASINKMRIRQRARLSTIKLGDANTRLFHLRSNGRRRKNFIQMLATPAGLAVTHCEKEEALTRHFSEFLGAAPPRSAALNWEAFGYAQRDLSHLEAPFSMEELKAAVFALPAEKAPGPDGFIGRFYRSCWETISEDLFDAMVALAEQGGSCFGLLNKANIVLLPKKAEAGSIVDYRPISLIHSFSKMLASRLAPNLPALISPSQSAFIKKRCIHDNFLHVQGLIREMFKENTPGFFLKLDIAKAFDTVNWSY
jgi:hypothetical protein